MLRALCASLLMLCLPQLAQANLKVFACEPEWAVLSETLGGDKVSVYRATTAQQDPHRIEARPSLIAQMRQADLVVCTGAELEIGWLPLLVERAGNPKVLPGQKAYFMAADQITLLDKLDKVDRSMGDVHAAGNPHIHLDPYRLLQIAKALAKRLGEVDSANASVYQQRLADFETRWQAAIKRWEQQAQSLKGLYVVVHHKDWRYLNNWLGMKERATLEPKPGVSPSASHLAKLKQQLSSEPASMILRAAYQEAKPAQWLSQQSNIPVVVLPYTVGGANDTNDLFALYDQTLARLLASQSK